MAAWEIEEPAEGEQFEPTSSIPTEGDGFLNETGTVKIRRNGGVVDAATVHTDGEGNWDHDFDPPTGGWTISENYEAEIWDMMAEQDQNTFKVIDPGP